MKIKNDSKHSSIAEALATVGKEVFINFTTILIARNLGIPSLLKRYIRQIHDLHLLIRTEEYIGLSTYLNRKLKKKLCE